MALPDPYAMTTVEEAQYRAWSGFAQGQPGSGLFNRTEIELRAEANRRLPPTCKQGHEFTSDTTGYFRSGARYCLACAD